VAIFVAHVEGGGEKDGDEVYDRKNFWTAGKTEYYCR
jgi:hypothetical protein